MDATSMPWSVGIRLAHASLQVLAEDHRIDLLHIKGPAIAPGLRAATHESIDADVLVRPAHVDRFIAVMEAHGWTTKYRFEDGSAFEHASTLVHPVLAPVDVHRRFPGMDAHPEAAFDRLWADRTVVDLAGLPCPAPSIEGQRLMLILHATRAGALSHDDIRRNWTDVSPGERQSLIDLAEALEARVALAAGTGRLAEMVGEPGHALWTALSTREESLVRIWAARVAAAPSRRDAARTAVRLLLPNRARMEVRLGRPPRPREIAAAYFSRSRRGAGEFVTYLRTTVRERTGR